MIQVVPSDEGLESRICMQRAMPLHEALHIVAFSCVLLVMPGNEIFHRIGSLRFFVVMLIVTHLRLCLLLVGCLRNAVTVFLGGDGLLLNLRLLLSLFRNGLFLRNGFLLLWFLDLCLRSLLRLLFGFCLHDHLRILLLDLLRNGFLVWLDRLLLRILLWLRVMGMVVVCFL